MLRSGAYSDEVVIRLLNRRFVPFYYDVCPPGQSTGDGWAYDADAARVIGRPWAGGFGQEGLDGRVTAENYPAAVFITPDGRRLDEDIMGILPPAEFVRRLREVMDRYPEYFGPTDEERAIEARAEENTDDPEAQLADARLAWELAEWDRVLRRAAAGRREVESPDPVQRELRLLEGRARICRGEYEQARAALEEAEALGGGDEVTAIHARSLLFLDRYTETRDLYGRLMADRSPFGGEAHYYTGLAWWREGNEEEALGVWRVHRAEWPMDRLARRSAASLGYPEAQSFHNQEMVDRAGWW